MSMNSKLNLQKQMKIKKPQNNPKQEQQSLKGQTSKIQNKLQSLKAEIAMRKTMKNKQKQTQQSSFKSTQKNATGQSWSTFNNTTTSNVKAVSQNSNLQLNKFLLGSSRQKFNITQQNTNQNPDRTKLQTLLQQLKMQQFRDAIIDKYQVSGLQRLFQLTQEDIDGWKVVPVGFRIKIRKFINQHKRNKQQLRNSQSVNQNQQLNYDNNSEDIEQIINRRKNQRVYEPITNKQLQQQQDQQLITHFHQQNKHKSYKNNNKNKKVEKTQQEQNNEDNNQNKKQQERITKPNQQQQLLQQEDEEDILISSLNSAFLQRRGIIKKQGSMNQISSPQKQNSKSRNKVHWDANVKQYNKQASKFKGQSLMTKYPVESRNPKQTSNFQELTHLSKNRTHYCWTCLKKITKLQLDQQGEKGIEGVTNKMNKIFCSIGCRQNYKNLIQTSEYKQGSQANRPTEATSHRQQKYQYKQDQDIVDLDLL